jgi:hypothetical protein
MIPNPVPEPESPDGWGDTIFWTAAACLSDRQLLVRSERWEWSPPGAECPPAAAHRAADGCIELRNCRDLDTYCVPNALLPLAVEGPLVELESPESCVALRDNAEARPGSPCSGEQICAIGFRTADREPGSAEPTLVWCHAERLRFSITYPGPFDYENVTSVLP